MCHSPVSCDLINLYYVSLQVLQESEHFYITAAPVPKGPFTIMLSWHQCSTSLTVTRPKIFVKIASSNYSIYCKGFCFRCYCTCSIWWLLIPQAFLSKWRVRIIGSHKVTGFYGFKYLTLPNKLCKGLFVFWLSQNHRLILLAIYVVTTFCNLLPFWLL